MKILSHNINGLNAYFKNGKLKMLFEDFPDIDVFCLQESKCNDLVKIAKLLEPYKEQFSVHVSCNNWKAGYAGVITLIRRGVKVGQTHSINLMSEYGEGRVLQTNFENFTLVNVYTMNSGNKDELRKEWDIKFSEYIRSIETPVVIAGDLNVCATELDYYGNYKRSINTMPGLMDFEIYGFDKLVTENRLIDAYRKLNPEIRKYSWYSTRNKTFDENKGWRLDYFLVSESIANNIINSDIKSLWYGADHSPIIIELYI